MKIIFITYSNKYKNNNYIIFDSVNRVNKYFKINKYDFSALMQPMAGEMNIYPYAYNLDLNLSFLFKLYLYFLSFFKFDRNKTYISLKIRDFFSVFSMLSSNKFYSNDIFIAVESINCLSLIIYKYLINRKIIIVYFCNDYSLDRYSFFFNFVYDFFDKFCSYYSDYNILMNMDICDLRIKKGFNLNKIKPTFDISGGINSTFNDFQYESRTISKTIKLIYATRDITYGLNTSLQLLYDCIKSSISVHLTITGRCTNNDINYLILKSPYLIECLPYITITGFLESDTLENIINNSDIGLAFYPIKNSSANYGDPEKIRRYFNSGLPIIATGGGKAVELISNSNSGIVCSSRSELLASIIKLTNNADLYKLFSINSYNIGQSYKLNDKFLTFLNNIK